MFRITRPFATLINYNKPLNKPFTLVHRYLSTKATKKSCTKVCSDENESNKNNESNKSNKSNESNESNDKKLSCGLGLFSMFFAIGGSFFVYDNIFVKEYREAYSKTRINYHDLKEKLDKIESKNKSLEDKVNKQEAAAIDNLRPLTTDTLQAIYEDNLTRVQNEHVRKVRSSLSNIDIEAKIIEAANKGGTYFNLAKISLENYDTIQDKTFMDTELEKHINSFKSNDLDIDLKLVRDKMSYNIHDYNLVVSWPVTQTAKQVK